MREDRKRSLAASPRLIGAVTVLVTLVAVTLAYNANQGLPFVPTYELRVRLPDAEELVPGNEVRVGGRRVGSIQAITAHDRGGSVFAELTLRLDQRLAELPRDTRVRVTPVSLLGLRYLELVPGDARRRVPHGGVLALEQATETVDLDEALRAFNRRTRAGLRGLLTDLGDGLAARGDDVNRAVDATVPLLTHLQPVMRTLAASRTDLAGFVRGAALASGTYAPVAPQLAALVDDAAATFAALDRAGPALERTILQAAPTERLATRALARVGPVLTDAAALTRDLRPGAAALAPAVEALDRMAGRAPGPLRRARPLADELVAVLMAARTLVEDPDTTGAVRRLTQVVASLQPTLRHLVPMQTRCNYLGLWTRNAASVVSEGDENGNWFRFLPLSQAEETFHSERPAPQLHANVRPHTGQNGECEPGNEPWRPGRLIGHPPGRQPGHTETTHPPAGVGR